MDDRFDQEFYRSEWQRVLPLGPHGIQPYVRASRTGALPGRHANLERLIATLGTAARDVIALGRFAAIGVAKRSMLPASAPHTQRPRLSRRLLHDRGHLVARRAAATTISGRAPQVGQKELKQLRAQVDIIAKHAGIMSGRRSGSSGARPEME